MFDRILLPLDGMSEREAILPYIRLLARFEGARVIVAHAVPFLETLLEMPYELSGPEISTDHETAETYVSAVVSLLNAQGVAAEGVTRIGGGIATIAEIARRERASLVALAAHRHSALARALLGSMTERMLRACPVPAYFLPLPPASAPSGRVSRILIPTDGSALSLGIVPFAAVFARLYQASLVFLHVRTPGEEAESAESVYARALELCAEEAVDAEMRVRDGDPAGEILQACRELSAGLIAMRARLFRGPADGPLGPITIRVLRAAQVPVLVVRRRVRGSLAASA